MSIIRFIRFFWSILKWLYVVVFFLIWDWFSLVLAYGNINESTAEIGWLDFFLFVNCCEISGNHIVFLLGAQCIKIAVSRHSLQKSGHLVLGKLRLIIFIANIRGYFIIVFLQSLALELVLSFLDLVLLKLFFCCILLIAQRIFQPMLNTFFNSFIRNLNWQVQLISSDWFWCVFCDHLPWHSWTVLIKRRALYPTLFPFKRWNLVWLCLLIW